MTSRSKNFNLSKEPFEGYVRHWKRQWVHFGDKARDQGTWTLKLIKWVQTEARVSSGSARHPHISPVTNLSLVPGGRVNSGSRHEPQANGQQGIATADQQVNTAAGDQLSQPPAADTLPQQQQQQHQELPPLPGTVGAGATTFIAAGAAAASGRTGDANLARVSSFYTSSFEAPSSSQQDMAAAAAAVAGSGLAEGTPGFALPSPSAVTGGAFSFDHVQGSQLQLVTTGSDFASIVPGASSAGGAASGYTAGTDRTDSDALGRLPHLDRAAASEYTDSMDVDLGISQGGASQQLTNDSGDSGDDLDSRGGEGDAEDEQPDRDASDDDNDRDDDAADDDEDGDDFVDDDSGDGFNEGSQGDGDDEDDEGAGAADIDDDAGIDDEDMP